MKKITTLSAAALLSMALATGCSASKPTDAKEMANQTCQALQAGDLDKVLSFMSPEAVADTKREVKNIKDPKAALIKAYKNVKCENMFLLGKGGGIYRFTAGSALGLMIQDKGGELSVIKIAD